MIISPFAKANFVDGTLTDQSSILRFIEDNWGTGRIGGGSSDATAGTLLNMFDFSHRRDGLFVLDPATAPTTGRDQDAQGRTPFYPRGTTAPRHVRFHTRRAPHT